MTAALAIIVVLLFAGLLLLFGAVLELHRQVHQIRQHAGLLDEARVVNHARDVLRSAVPGFDATMAEPDARSAVLLLSDTCSTCYEISGSLGAFLVPELVVVIATRSEEAGQLWLEEQGLTGFANVFVDDGKVADQLDLHVVPSVVRFQGLNALSATTVPSVRQLKTTVEWLTAAPRRRGQAAFPSQGESFHA
jgi:hypothetical protein